MDCEQLKTLIKDAIPDADVQIDSPDNHHFFGCVISPSFEGQSPINRQRRVNTVLEPMISSGELHAISFKTKTPEEMK